MILPEKFVNRMKNMLGSDYQSFEESYGCERYTALRINPMKAGMKKVIDETGWKTERVPWEENGLYYDAADMPGKHPYHDAGVYYIQEPSAMAPVHYLCPGQGERILDLCAAPGGKSTQIAAAMNNNGLLICNEINTARAKILSQNIERMGVKNAMVLNETPDHLAAVFPGYFDRILVDAPCSGEGMFRKNEDACAEWSEENVQMCAERQADILDMAAVMLIPGGRLVYSTCTFSPAENERSISDFIHRHGDFHIVPVSRYEGMDSGHPEWTDDPCGGISETVRLWPHRIHGEGHFLAVLERDGNAGRDISGKAYSSVRSMNGTQNGLSGKEMEKIKPYRQFAAETLKNEPEGQLFFFGDNLYLAPYDMPSTDGLRVMRPGLQLGVLKKDRFEPSHALALYLKAEDAVRKYDMSSSGNEIRQYLNGQTLNVSCGSGWYLMTVDGYSIGWGKSAGGIMKNHYPRGLRINY